MVTGSANRAHRRPPLTQVSYAKGRALVSSCLAGLLAVATISGCGEASTHPVEGTVTYRDGSPVTRGNVVFSSVDLQPSVSAKGSIGPDGTFRLGTLRPGDGAPAGKYRAVVSEPLPDDMDSPAPPTIHPRFRDFDTSGLEFEVLPGRNRFTISVARPGR